MNSSARLKDDGTIELTTVTESGGNVLHTAVTKINLPENYEKILDIYQTSNEPLRIIEEDSNGNLDNKRNYYETEITTTHTINPDGSVTKTIKSVTTVKKTTVITILTGDGKVLVKKRAI